MASEGESSQQFETKLDALRGLKGSNTANYYQVAALALVNAENELRLIEASGDITEVFTQSMVRQPLCAQHIATAIVFSALCVEAIINFALDANVTGKFKESLERLDPAAKWVVVLKFVYGHDLRPEAGLVQDIRDLAKNRNGLVHAKPRTLIDKDLNVIPEETLVIESARRAVETAKQAIRYLYGIDPTLSEFSGWSLKSVVDANQ